MGCAFILWQIVHHYNPMDASWNTASEALILHPYGALGSFLADITWQFFGFYAYGLCCIPMVLSMALFQQEPLRFLRRSMFILFAMSAFGIGTVSFWNSQTGSLAYILYHKQILPLLHSTMMPAYLGISLDILIKIISLMVGTICMLAALSMSMRGSLYALYSISTTSRYMLIHLIRTTLHGFSFLGIILNPIVTVLFKLGYVVYGLFKFSKLITFWRTKNQTPAVDPFQRHHHEDPSFTQPSLFSNPSQQEADASPTMPLENRKDQLTTWLSEKFHDLDAKNAMISDTIEDDSAEETSSGISIFQKMRDAQKNKSTQSSKPKNAPDLFSMESSTTLLGGYDLPPITLLDPLKAQNIQVEPSELEESGHALEKVLMEFGVKGEIVNIRPGPVVTLYELKPAPGIKSSRVIGLAEDIARSMCALSARIAVVPGKNVIGIELPNPKRETVFMRDMLESDSFGREASGLRLILGKDIGGKPVIADLARMPHLLVAGTTGSGKSVSVNTMILSLLYKHTPDQCKFIMIDPKMLELSIYNDIPHLLTPVVTDPKKAVVALKWAVKEMESRYRAMSKMSVRNIEGYNTRVTEAQQNGEMLMRKVQTGFDADSGKPVYETQPMDLTPLPFIVVVVDEMADLMLVAGKEIEATIQRLAQMARAAGIHLIMATQRPSVDVITGTIKANFPTRISFQVTSKIDSRTILSEQGAEQLLGQGDMLYMAGGGRIQRVHGPFVRDDEVERVVDFLKQQGEPEYVDSVVEDDEEDTASEPSKGGDAPGRDALYEEAVDLIIREGKASTSFIQRHFAIGYNRAARLMDHIEKDGIITPANHAGKREVLGRSSG